MKSSFVSVLKYAVFKKIFLILSKVLSRVLSGCFLFVVGICLYPFHKNTSASLETESYVIESTDNTQKVKVSKQLGRNKRFDKLIYKVGFPLNLINQEDAFAMLDRMSEKSLTGYLKNMVDDESMLSLIDKRVFAKNAITQLYKTNEDRNSERMQLSVNQSNNQTINQSSNQAKADEGVVIDTDIDVNKQVHQWQGNVTIGFSAQYPQQSVDTSQLDVNQKIYAHIKTSDIKQHKGRIFISWIHKESRNVHLFNMKKINPYVNENWVSLKLNNGWKKGTYEIVFYEFTNELKPIAQTSYTIENVNGRSLSKWDEEDEFDFLEDEISIDDEELFQL